MDDADPLAALRDIQLPGDPSWWPPALGWWILVIALIALVVLAVVRAWSIYRRHLPGSTARKLLADIENRYRHKGDAAATARSLSELVRRYLLTRYDREVVAGSVGDDFTKLIRSQLKDTDVHSLAANGEDVSRLLKSFDDGPYRPEPTNVDDMFVVAHALLARRALR